MADGNNNLIETTGRVKRNPVPLSFGGVKKQSPGQITKSEKGEAKGDRLHVEDPRKIIRQGMLIIFFFFGILGVWSFFGHISGAVIAPGKIKIDNERKIVQHLEGGIVEEILVKEGEEVREGQPLIVLKSVEVDANTNMLQKELVAQEAQMIRFLAEKENYKKLEWPKELKELAENSQSLDALANEERIFATRQETLQTQVSLLESQIAQLSMQVEGQIEELKASDRVIASIQEELGAKRKLHKDRYVDKTQILALERDLAGRQGARGRLRQSISEAKQRGAELNLRITEVKIRFVEEATKNLGDLENRLAQTRERLRPLTDKQSRLQITAPVAGRVVDLKVHTPGSIVQGGQTLMDIVPHDNPLIVVTEVPVKKITEVYVGQPARVSLDAFDTRIIPQIPGKVTYVSADRIDKDGAEPHYLCFVEVDPDAMRAESLYLTPGMPATVYLTTTQKTVAYYIFEPYIKSWERALRD